ncbi:CRM family member 2 isoform X2 [Carex rostrata]
MTFLSFSTFSTIKLPIQHQQLPYSYYRYYRYSYNAVIVAALPLTSASSSPNLRKASESAIKRISDKLRQLRYVNSDPDPKESESESVAAGEIFIPTPHDVPLYQVGSTLDSDSRNKETVPSVAELTLPVEELKRLRTVGIRLREKLSVGKAGITEGIVNGIHERWRRSEVVKIKCDDLCRINMKRTHQILERKTGGLVVWRSGSVIILYRGSSYNYPYFKQPDSDVPNGSNNTLARPALVPGVGSQNIVRLQLSGEAKVAEEADRVLNGLGPRFLDWWGLDPKPIDADLLPGVVIGFRKPFRILPFGIKQNLTDSEMTTLRRLGRPLPCHFAIGRNRNLQGLAQAMINLWEKCEIAKIAAKRGVQNTDTEIIAEELKKLTGGTLLSRDSEYIVFYRGKDFLPLAVSTAIEERRKSAENAAKVEEELNEEREIADTDSVNKETIGTNTTPVMVSINKLEAKLTLALTRKERAEKLLEELENSAETQREEHDYKETISEEERFMLRKVGLKMKTFLLMGRKGVFDGTVENMHLHWKYRELVKIISKEKYDIKEVENAARILESESGGILVGVERVSKGHAIIIYRGKNYRRPKTLRPKSLLTKREAMKRSLEAQRRKSLKLHVLNLSRNIEEIKQSMIKDESSPAHSIQNSIDDIEDSAGPTSSRSNDLETSHDNSEDAIKTAWGAPTLATGEEVSIADSKLATKIQPTDIQIDVCSTSGTNSCTDEIPFKPSPLTNKERLVLRKQALKMQKRPVLSVGRHNVITGVAKTIKTHFQKHPLAIVNIKNRAEGTSVQRLISELEEATGSVLVSREPNKVILYRGWQEGEKPGDVKKTDDVTQSTWGESGAVVYPELMEAIRVECGLHAFKEEEE